MINTRDLSHDEFVSSFPAGAAHAAWEQPAEPDGSGVVWGVAWGLAGWAIVAAAVIAAVY